MTKKLLALSMISFVLGFLGISPCTAQTPGSMPGTPPFSATINGPADQIDPANLNVTIKVPVVSNMPGRGIPLSYNLIYNSAVWNVYGTSWQPATAWGWSTDNAAALGYETYWDTGEVPCYGYDEYYDWVQMGYTENEGGLQYVDPQGVGHTSDWYVNIGVDWYADDSPISDGCSGNYSNYGGGGIYDGSVYSGATPGGVSTRSGAGLTVPVNTTSGPGSIIDANGNEITSDGSSVTNTLGNVAVSYSSNPQYTAPSGATASYGIVTTSKSIKTNFGCSGIGDYTGSAYLITEIDLPDHAINSSDKYLFTYEATPGYSGYVTGRIASVTLPTGGTITYAYSGGHYGINCDGSTATLTRYTPDSGSNYWTYSHSLTGSYTSSTTITDPQGNQTVMDFNNIYPMSTAVYSGSSTSGTLLKTISSCYTVRGSFSPFTVCPGSSTAVGVPFNKIATTTAWPGGLQSEVATSYSTYEMPTEVDEYGYGSGAPGSLMRKTLTTYATLTGIVDHPSEITVEDGSGNVKADTQYQYDQYSVLTTSGTPQFVSSGSIGNVTTVKSLVGSSTYLTQTYTYYDTGNVYQATDVNGAVTTYNYSSSGASCGNAFPTSISEPLSLSRSMTYDCTGGVQVTATDESGQTVTTSYSDPYFWRPASVTDQIGNVAYFTYTPMTTEAAMTYSVGSGTSTTDVLATVDNQGRLHVAQLREGPGSGTWDSVEADYDSLGRQWRTSQPYSAGASSTCSTGCYWNTSALDPLGRTLSATDPYGNVVMSYTYSQNDVYLTAGPAPSGENTKRRQLEYDGLGRLASVCEITGMSGSGACSQTNAATGFWTKYTYDPNNKLTGVTQNAQGSPQQTRSYSYDDLSRMTSETNPESGTTTYTYDSSACTSSAGDLVLKVDAASTGTCFYYDALHRLTDVGTNRPTVDGCKRFRYDGSTGVLGSIPSGVSVANTMGRVAEVETDTCAWPITSASIITDEWFSYSQRGEQTDLYQSTPHSGGYYHSEANFWANGQPQTIWIPGGYWSSYGLDGEGRIDSNGNAAVTSVSYNVAGQPTQLNLGSGDSDNFSYDPGTGRMTQYKYTVGGQSVVGNLTWNALGTLASLAITDPFNSANAQTCNYTHDDLERIASDNCGSIWSQTFSYYDPFGNIEKSGSSTFSATYSSSTNRMTLIGSSTPSYDSDGNVTNDFLHTYAWDGYGRPTTIDGVGATYDALGRMVELNNSGSYTDFRYSPTGFMMQTDAPSGSSAFVPSPGGAVAIWTSTGNILYRHPDWLGSSRFTSAQNQTMYSDSAYGPFGEVYAQAGTADASFTGMNQGTVSNLYDFPAREYGIQGRWPSPDPSGIAAVDPTDPQSWNRYAYTRNSPLNLTDPSGLDYEVCVQTGEYLDGGDPSGCFTESTFGDLESIIGNSPSFMLAGGENGGDIYMTDCCIVGYYNYFDPSQSAAAGSSGSGQTNPGTTGSGGGAATSAPSSSLSSVKSKICSLVPQGQALSGGGALGFLGSTLGSANVVTNYNTGISSFSMTGGLQVGPNGAASVSVSGGYIYSSSTFANSDYSGPFTTGSIALRSGPGVFSQTGGNTKVAGISMGASLIETPALTVGKTVTTPQIWENLIFSAIVMALDPGAASNTAARMACNGSGG
jgi:RHS repeat-associated protein